MRFSDQPGVTVQMIVACKPAAFDFYVILYIDISYVYGTCGQQNVY